MSIGNLTEQEEPEVLAKAFLYFAVLTDQKSYAIGIEAAQALLKLLRFVKENPQAEQLTCIFNTIAQHLERIIVSFEPTQSTSEIKPPAQEKSPTDWLTIDSLLNNGMVSADVYIKVGVTQTGECVYVNLNKWPESTARIFIAFIRDNPGIAVEDIRKKLQSIEEDLPAEAKTWSFKFAPKRVIPTLAL